MVVTRYVFVHKLAENQYLLVNSLTGAVDVVEEYVIQAFSVIRRGETPELPEDTTCHLKGRGYLYPSRSDEEAIVQRVIELNEKLRATKQAICFVMCPTTTCNLRCPYCFEPHKMHAERRLMTPEQVEKAFGALDQIRLMRPEMPDATINLFGGEPLLPFTKGVVALIMAGAADRELPVSITSNGTYAAAFLEILQPHRDRILFDISIDGVKEIHDQRRVTASGAGTFDSISRILGIYAGEGLEPVRKIPCQCFSCY
jgi:uncharacterized protein